MDIQPIYLFGFATAIVTLFGIFFHAYLRGVKERNALEVRLVQAESELPRINARLKRLEDGQDEIKMMLIEMRTPKEMT